MSDDRYYYLARNGRTSKATAENVILQAIRSGRLEASVLICPVGGTSWSALSVTPPFAGEFAPGTDPRRPTPDYRQHPRLDEDEGEDEITRISQSPRSLTPVPSEDGSRPRVDDSSPVRPLLPHVLSAPSLQDAVPREDTPVARANVSSRSRAVSSAVAPWLRALPRGALLLSVLALVALGGVARTFVYVLSQWDRASENNTTAPRAEVKSQAPAVPPPALPAPYAGVRLGMTRAELTAMYPAQEDISSCRPVLLGREGGPRRPPVPGRELLEGAARSACAGTYAIGGVTDGEMVRLLDVVTRVASESRQEAQLGDVLGGLVLTMAQVRGAVRARAVGDEDVFQGNHSEPVPAYEAVPRLASALSGGTLQFLEGRAQLRFIALAMRDDCSGIDPGRSREFVEGRFGRGEIVRLSDAAARRCGYAMLRAQGRLGGEFLAATGGVAGVGLSRGLNGASVVTPDSPARFRDFQRRAGLEPSEAAFAVRVANALPVVEAFWAGAVQVEPRSTGDTVWGSAVVWLVDDRVTRVLVNIRAGDRIADLARLLSRHLGAPGVTVDAVTTWTLPDGVLRLDVGAALALTLEAVPAGP